MASQEIEDLYTSLTTPHIQGVCKDCHAGTLNNDLNPAFELEDYPHCLACGSTHIELL
jgi:hypothetical protein